MSTQGSGNSLPRIPTLDGLRGIAILVVIMQHIFVWTPLIDAGTFDMMFGRVFVLLAPLSMDLFFVISGYLITSILDRTRDADHPLRTFYLRRALRIVPLYYGFLLVVLVFFRHYPERLIGAPGSMVWEFLFLTNVPVALRSVGTFFHHFWTLAVEEQFYVMWPLLMLLLPTRLNVKTCIAVIIGSVILRAILAFTIGTMAGFLLTPGRLDALAAGSVVALIQNRNPALLTAWSKKLMWSGGIACLLGHATVVVLFMSGFTWLSPKVWVTVMPFFASVFFAAVVAHLALSPRLDGPRWLLSPVLRSVARYSYGMYALHVPIGVLMFHHNLIARSAPIAGFHLPYRIYLFILVGGLSYGFGLASWHLYEKQFLKLAPRYRYSGKTQAVESALQGGAIPVP